MNKYQLLFIIDSTVGDSDKEALIKKFTDLIVTLGGVVDATDKWGAKKFAYEIDGKTEGYYVLVKFSAGANAPAEIDRQMRNNDSIIRQMITRI
jgi:small subunit ribosomal protein S6